MAVNQYKRSQLGELGKFLDSLDEKDKKQKETTAVLESKKENQASQYGADLTKFLDSQNDKNKAITKKSHLEAQAKRLWESPVVAETRASNHSFAPLTTEQLSKAETDRQLALKKQQEEAQAAKQKEEAFRASERDYAAKRASLSPVKTGIAHKYTDSDLPVDPILSRASYLAEQAGTGMSKFGTDLKNSVSAISDSSSAFLGKLFGMKSPENGYTPIDSARKSTKPTLRSASDISANGLKDESTLLKKAANAGSEALSDSLEQSILDNAEYAKRREEIEKKYSKAQIGTVSKFLGDIAYGAGYAAPGIAVSKIIPYASVALMGTSNFSGAYAQAKARGDDDEQALKYASLTSIPRMGSEFFFNQLSDSLTKKPIAKAVSRIANPYARAAADVGINAAGEGVEETLDYLYDTAVRKAIGEKDVKVNPSEMAYQGLLGAGTSALFGLASYPGKVQTYKFDADFVNAYSKAAAKVDTDEKADILTRVGDIISEKASEIMNDPSSSRDDIARANYYKTAIDDVNNTLKGYKDRIIIDNQETNAAVNSVIFSSADDMYNSSVDLSLVVAKNLEPDENPVNATVDVIRDKIQDKKEEIRKTTDPAEKKSLENQVEQLKKADETVRSNRAEIENAVEAQRKTEADKAKTNKPAESTAKTTDVELTADNNNAIIEKDLSQVSKDKGEKLEDSNVKLSKDFEDYSINQQDVIEGYEESVDTSFREFIEREMRGELKQNDSYALKNVSDKAAADIKKAVGVDATGFKTVIEARMVTHILQGHGENGTTDHSMANIDDIARMQFVIDNYDNIEDGGKCKSYFESYVSRSGEVRQHTAHTVVYSKKVNGVYYVVEAVPDTKRKTAYIISAYMSKKERNGLSNENNNENVAITRSVTSDTAEKPRAFESAPDAHSLNEIISNNSDAVNSESKKSPKEFSLTHKKFKHTQTGETLDLYTIDGYIDKDKYSKLKDNIKSVGGYYSKYAGGFLVPADKIASVSEFADVTEPVVRDKPEDTVSAVKADEQEATPVETNAVSDSVESDSAQGTREMQAAKETVPPVSATEEAKTELKKDESKSKLLKDITLASQDTSEKESAPQKKSSKTQTITSKSETSNTEVKEKHRAMENGVLPNVIPEVSTSVSDAGNGVSSETVASDSVVNTFYSQIADRILNDYLKTGAALDSKALIEIANSIYGGTLAEGVFDIKDATDSLELAVNRYLLEEMQNKAAEFNGKSAKSAEDGIVWMEELLQRIPTQTKRTDEQVSLQQFSTPPNIAYLANWLANIDSSDFMLEPSAGIGGLAAFAKAFGATTAVNEISERRLGALRSLGFDHVTSEDGAQLDNILPDYIKPTVVVMNPPFSSTGGRTKNSTANAKPHVEQALGRLENGGRLVAILGQGMSNDAPAFAAWWDSLRKQGYNIRANIGIDGTNYRKYGTTFNVRLVVIDKDGSSGSTVTGDYTKLYEIPKVLEEIRNDRRKNVGTAESNRAVEDNKRSSRGARNVSESKRAVSDSVPTENAADMGSGNAVERRVSSDSRRGIRSESDTLEHVQPDTGTAVSGNDEQSGGRGLSSGNDGSVVDVAQNESGRGKSGSIVGGRGSSDRNLSDDLGQSGNADVESSGERRRGGVTKSPKKSNTQKKKANTSDDGIYAGYVPSKLTVKNAQKHPANLVESSAMAAVSSPVITYTPHIDQSIIDKGLISDVQLENISYAGQAHEEMLESGSRRGYFIGDGTGVGKGRQAAGIILDNFNQGRKKALWVSEKAALMEDAKRDWRDIGGNPDQIFNIDGIRKGIGKGKDKTIPTDGILYTTYSMVRSGKTKDSKLTNADKIIEWLGKDFDGVIIYDEAHNMNTLLARGTKKGSQQAIEANKIQEKLPNARVVYMSATGAVEVEDLCFASRLGLWGKGTQFTDANDFTEKIGASGVAGMELVASSLKAMGAYQARSISYEGVRYDSIKHVLSKSQRVMYDTFCEAWQITLQNMEKAIGATKLKNAGTARSLYYSAMQNFYNQVLSSMAMPSVIEDIKKEIAAGHSCVIQLINTNEAQQDRELARVKAEGEDLDDLDITPRGALLGFLENSFPVQQYEEFLDEHGNKQSRPVVDSKGNPVLNKSAVAARDELIERIKEMSIPEGPIDMIINAFGADKVAEVTGRSRRIIMKPDENGNMKKVEETLKPDFRVSETTAFQNGDKHILIFSNAGSTGRSYHADKRAKNQEQRVHYVLQPGWNAKTATQGFGRTHRSNQVSAPIYKLITTDIEGQRRFVTSIARRLDQLGALTKGQRQTGSGIFGEKDNLESPLSRDALRIFYKRLGTGGVAGVDGKDIFRKLGLYRDFFDNEDKFKPSSPKADDITTFLNRLLALKVDEQNIVFGEFETLRQQMYDEAIANGTLDTGISNVKADKITVDQEETIYTDEKTGAETKYVRATAFRKPAVIETVEDAQVYRNAFQGLVRMSDDSVRAVYRIADETTTWGGVMKKYLLQSPNRSVQSRYNEVTMRQKTTKIPEAEWESAWAEERKNVPEFNESTLNIVTGALLPVWNKLPQDGNIKALKIVTDNGDQILGRIISDERIEGVLRQLDVKKKTEKLSGAKIFDMVLKNGKQFTFSQSYSGNNTIKRSRVANENRIEITGTNMWQLKADYPEIFTETIQSSRRYFIPTGKKGVEIIEAINKQYPMKAVSKDSDTSLFFSRADGKWGKGDESGNKIKSLNDLKNEASSLFGVEINTGKVGVSGAAGVYNTHAGTIRTRVHGDLPTIAHELGHHFDKKYKLTELPEVESLIDHYRSDLEDADYNESLFPYESVAYYFADLMRDAQKTEKMFPEFTQALKATMDKSYTASGKEKINPEAARLKKFMEMSNEYNAADRLRRREAAVHYRHKDESFLGEAQFQIDTFLKNPAAYSGRLGRRFIRRWFDDIVEFENFGKAHDLGMKERAANSIVNGRLTIAFTDNHGKVIGSSLAAVLEEGGINDLNVKAFESYLTARIALDRIEAGEKDSSIGTRVYADEELQNRDNIIEDIKAYELKNPTFADAAKGVYEYENHLLDIAVDSGIISEKLSKSLRELFPHYVPLYRSMRDSSGAYSGRGSQTPSSVVKRFKGSGRDVNSPIENIMYQTAAWSKAILQNETRKEVFDYIDKNENMGMWAEKVPESKYYDMVRTDEIASKIAGFDSDKLSALSSEDKAELVDEIMKTIGNSTGMWKKRQYQGKNVVSVMRNGNPVYYEIHDDGLMEAFKALTPSQTSIVMRIFGTVTNAFTAVTTGSNPRFGYTNLQRDAQSGYIFSKTQDNPFAYTLDLIKAFGESVINSEDYKAYVSNGGGYTGAFTMNMGRLKEKYNEVVKSSSAAKRAIGNIKDLIPHIIESVESASRYAEYKRNIKEGADALDALRAAQNITVNFQQGGSYSKAVGRFIPFFNASMTSLYQNIRRLNPTDKDKRVLIKWLGMNLLLPALVIAFNEMMKLVLDDDDDPDEAYSRLSAYNKNANWNFYIGDGQFVRIPKERSLMVPASLLSATYEYYAMENPEAFYNYGKYILDSFLPPGPADATLVGSLLDLATNKTFTGAPIVPTAYTYRAKPEQYNERTSELAISLGSALGLSPMQIDYLIDDNLGFVGDLILNLTKQGGAAAKDILDLTDTSKKTILGGISVPSVVMRDSTYSTDIVSIFYDTKENYDKNAASYKATGGQNDRYSFYDTYGKYKYGKVADLYSDVNKLIKSDKNSESSRETRWALNTIIKSVNETEKTQLDEDVAKLAYETGSSMQEIAPYIVVPESIKSKDKKVYSLDAYDMMNYYTESQALFEIRYKQILSAGYDADSTAAALKEMKKEIKAQMDERYLEKLRH